MLELKNVSKTFNPGTINAKTALSCLNLRLNDGDFVTVIGGNGAGKSTMLNAIAGAFEIDGGSISIDGVDITRQSEHKRAAMIGRVFQDPMLGTAPTMTIEENLALAARRGRRRTLAWGIKRTERSHYRDQLARLGLGLEDRMTSRAGLLSGGQRQGGQRPEQLAAHLVQPVRQIEVPSFDNRIVAVLAELRNHAAYGMSVKAQPGQRGEASQAHARRAVHHQAVGVQRAVYVERNRVVRL